MIENFYFFDGVVGSDRTRRSRETWSWVNLKFFSEGFIVWSYDSRKRTM